MSACIAAELAKGKTVEEAIRTAKDYVNIAIGEEIIVGHKYGLINHWAAEKQLAAKNCSSKKNR